VLQALPDARRGARRARPEAVLAGVSIPDSACAGFLQAALPRLHLRWPGFRKVRRLVCKRLGSRLRQLGLADLASYRAYLDRRPEEWTVLDGYCRIPISRFYRDHDVFERLERNVLPALGADAMAAGRSEIACWSAGCASGEEPYTVSILWHLGPGRRFPALRLRLVATDIEAHLLERARTGCYRTSSLKALPRELWKQAFVEQDGRFCIRDEFRAVEFLQQDIRQTVPEGEFDLILCRNAALTYFAPALQSAVTERIAERLRPGGALVIGIHESLPETLRGFALWPGARAIYRRLAPPAPAA
jgi:chemotaxis protein methyltransferase CheR